LFLVENLLAALFAGRRGFNEWLVQIFQKYAGPNGRLLLKACHEVFDTLPLCALIQVGATCLCGPVEISLACSWMVSETCLLGCRTRQTAADLGSPLIYTSMFSFSASVPRTI